MRSLLSAIVLLCCVSCGGSSPSTTPSPVQTDAQLYLNQMIDVMQASSVNRLTIDWTTFRAQVLAAAPSAKTIADTYPAISVALGLLGDHHSFYRKPNNSGNILNPNPPPGCGVATVPDASVPADIGYVRIPAFNGDNVAEVNLATSLHARIAAQDRSDLAGWIVDVRGNGGGDMWPMIAGVGPILGDGTAGYFISVTGTTPWGYNGVGSFDGTFVAVRPDPVYRLIAPNPRVAVLTNEGVASSGEAVVVAFRGRPNTRSFGARTCGVPTSNAGHTLSDGAVLFVTDAVDGDRNRNRYDSPIFPDEPIADSSTTVDRAIQWLRGG